MINGIFLSRQDHILLMTAVSDNAYTSHIIERLTTEVINNTIKSLEWENTAAVLSGKTVLDA